MVNPFTPSSGLSRAQGVTFDEGLRAHMVRVFGTMSGGLAVTGLVALLVAYTPIGAAIFGNKILGYAAMFSPLLFMFFMNFKLMSAPAATAKTMFWVFCSLMGLSMSTIFMVFTTQSIAGVFFITAATFSAMALWGYTTKKDLTSMGAFLMMGVMGIFIASLVNLFMGSGMMQWVISVAGVGIFTGLTAYDTQNIKRMYSENWGQEANSKLAVIGALSLYMNFINAFQFLLSLMGDRR
ncbi:MAG: Bax inhibitor-1/YccA family protein [Alphaproteobacteria bacterium]|nr:Bax inhibitor-1/YccA family protein [Alphaproteobacteria bacterium]